MGPNRRIGRLHSSASNEFTPECQDSYRLLTSFAQTPADIGLIRSVAEGDYDKYFWDTESVTVTT